MKKFVSLLLALLMLFSSLFILIAGADFGDYAGDSDYNFGGSSNGSYSGSRSSHHGSSGGSDFVGSGDHDNPVHIAILIGMTVGAVLSLSATGIVLIVNIRRRNSVLPDRLSKIREYRKLCPGFSERAFADMVAERYREFQKAWQNKDLSPLRPYLSDPFFAQMDRQLDAYRKNGLTNVIDNISVENVKIVGWKTEGGEDVVFVRLVTRITDYVISDATGVLVRGSKRDEKVMEYEWTLCRSTEARTDTRKNAYSCPNCGAALDINKTAECPYCGSIVTVGGYDWVVSSIRGISQRTIRK